MDSRFRPLAFAALAALASSTAGTMLAQQTDFVTTVVATKPIAYYRLDAASGKSQVGSSAWKPQGGVSTEQGGAPTGSDNYLKLDGKTGWIETTQKGGVGDAASMMAWVNLTELPSKAGRIFYVSGESQSGNDLDLQFETDNALRFFTAGGGRAEYAPPPATLVNKWHMIVATLDTVTKARVIYWDGKAVAKDMGGGQPNKTSEFSIGESTVFTGRWFNGGVEDVALWNRALKAAEVAAIYAAANGASGGSTGAASASGNSGSAAKTGPFATTAKVEAEDAKGPIQLKREEQIALMFLSAAEQIEHDCQLKLQRACSFAELLSGAGGEHFKFDPTKNDPNYTYTFAVGGLAWEAHANARKPGLKGFCFMARSIGTTVTTYSAAGKSGWTDTDILGRSIEGDTFDAQ